MATSVHSSEEDGERIDVGRQVERYLPLGRHRDATQLLLNLSMNHGHVFLRWDSKRQQYVVTIEGRQWFGHSQIDAMHAALDDLE